MQLINAARLIRLTKSSQIQVTTMNAVSGSTTIGFTYWPWSDSQCEFVKVELLKRSYDDDLNPDDKESVDDQSKWLNPDTRCWFQVDQTLYEGPANVHKTIFHFKISNVAFLKDFNERYALGDCLDENRVQREMEGVIARNCGDVNFVITGNVSMEIKLSYPNTRLNQTDRGALLLIGAVGGQEVSRNNNKAILGLLKGLSCEESTAKFCLIPQDIFQLSNI